MSQLHHIYCGLLFFLCFAGDLTLEVGHESTQKHLASAGKQPLAEAFRILHQSAQPLRSLSLQKSGSKGLDGYAEVGLQKSGAKAFGGQAIHLRDGHSGGGSSNYQSQKLQSLRTDDRTVTFILAMVTVIMIWALLAVGLLTGSSGGGSDASKFVSEPPAESTHPPCNYNMPRASYEIYTPPPRFVDPNAQAISLLLECNIIAKKDLESDSVSQEHLADCIAIAYQMLDLRTFDEWVTLSKIGRQSFIDTVAAISEARENANAAIVQARAEAKAPSSPTMEFTFGSDLPETHVPLSVPVTSSSLKRADSSGSLGSGVSFGYGETKDQELSLPDLTPSLPHKSPVPALNCYDQVSVSSRGGEPEEVGFASVLNTIPSMGSEAAVNEKSSPATPSKLCKLSSQEVLAPPPPGWTLLQRAGPKPTGIALKGREALAPSPEPRVREPIAVPYQIGVAAISEPMAVPTTSDLSQHSHLSQATPPPTEL